MRFFYPKGLTESDFKNRLSGKSLMERWDINFIEINNLSIQSYKEVPLIERAPLTQKEMESPFSIITQKERESTIYIEPVRPMSTTDMRDCFYLISDIQRIEREQPEAIKGQLPLLSNETSFSGHPLGKATNEDPLFVAVKLRAALMNKLIQNPHNLNARSLLSDWVKTNYPKISKRQTEHIVSIVNDGYGVGQSKK